MESRLLQETRALDTMENVLAALRNAEERDDTIERLIQAIEDDRAVLLASRLGRVKPLRG